MLVIVPSRGRPGKIAELIESWTMTRSYARLMVVVDDDDETLSEYVSLMTNRPSWVEFMITSRKRLGPTLNEFAVQQAPYYDIIGFMGDDHRPRTINWDRRFAGGIATLGGTGIVYGNDLIQGANIPTAVWMSSSIIEALGYMVPPGMIHLYLDNFWKELGLRTNRLSYLNDVIIEHMHPIAQKSEWDDLYAEVNSEAMYVNDGKVFEAYVQNTLQLDANKINEISVQR